MTKENRKYIGGLIAVGVVWIALTLSAWFKPPHDISESERRKLEQPPKLTVDNLASGGFMTDFENYATDQFPMRDSFRRLKATAAFGIFGQKDNNSIYIADGHAAKIEYPFNQNSANNAVKRFNKIYDKYIRSTDNKVYLSIVPDKHYYLASKHGYPRMNYERLIDTVRGGMDFAEYIDITGCLSIDDYYSTDPHWRQEKITAAADKISQAMSSPEINYDHYREAVAEENFYGAYYGQSALPLDSESIKYLTNDVLEKCMVYNAETGTTGGIYDFSKLNGYDRYDFFLSGASPVIKINNPSAAENRRLVVFRDSFGSSIVPLLVEGYSEITLIDIRYISSDMLENYAEFDNCDVLFLYSTSVLNNSGTLK